MADCGDGHSTNVEANLPGEHLVVFFFFGRAAVELDTRHDLVLSHLGAVAMLPMERHLLPVLLQLLVEEDLQLLVRAQLTNVLVDVLLGVVVLLFVVDLPEPLVDLVLLHVELLC